MLLNKHLYNRALKKKKNDQKKRGLDSLTPKTSLDGLSINLQKELLKEEKPDEFKKVVIKDNKKELIKKPEDDKDDKDNKDDKDDKDEIQEEGFSHVSNVENLEEDDKGEILDLEPDEEFEVIDNEQQEDLEGENDLIEEPDKDQSGGGLSDIKKVVVSFF
jgi:hypothetical protein